MFQFSGFATLGLHVFNVSGCPIRTSTDQRSFAPPRCFSQLTTSFVASGSQGIPHTLFLRFQLFNSGPETLAKLFFIAARMSMFPPTRTLLFLARLLFLLSSLFSSLLLLLFPSLVNELFISIHELCTAKNEFPSTFPLTIHSNIINFVSCSTPLSPCGGYRIRTDDP
jgi:hypothetical protein